jgi:hypothetical protein
MQCLYMPQIMLGLGVDAEGNLTNLYTGPNFSEAKDAVNAAGQSGAISIGYLYSNPPPVTTLRFEPTPAQSAQPA